MGGFGARGIATRVQGVVEKENSFISLQLLVKMFQISCGLTRRSGLSCFLPGGVASRRLQLIVLLAFLGWRSRTQCPAKLRPCQPAARFGARGMGGFGARGIATRVQGVVEKENSFMSLQLLVKMFLIWCGLMPRSGLSCFLSGGVASRRLQLLLLLAFL